jgi:ferredoxin-thioredoxin reductase catalytic subunit
MITHNCSSKVEHAEWGSGECIKEMHTLDETGRISHYDVIFAHGIEENVSVQDLTTEASEMHEHAVNDDKNEVVESMKQARKNVGASTCWKGYKAQGTKTKDGKVVPNCVKENEEIEETVVQLKGKKKGNVIINPEVKKVDEDVDVAKKQQVQRKQLTLNRQKLALQQRATAKKKPADMHMEETEDIQEVDVSTRSVDYGQEIENTALKRKKEKKSLTSFKKLSKPTES